MKKLTKIAFVIGLASMYAGLINIYLPAGLASMGLWAFCFVYDKEFRRKF